MYKVYAEHYYNDLRTSDVVLYFRYLDGDDFAQWMDEHYGRGCSGIPCSADKRTSYWPGRIDLGTMSDGGCWWIHQIDGPRGIEFTDGRRTDGKKHISKHVLAVLDAFVDEKSNPEARFVE